jgi:hypothetical protein
VATGISRFRAISVIGLLLNGGNLRAPRWIWTCTILHLWLAMPTSPL